MATFGYTFHSALFQNSYGDVTYRIGNRVNKIIIIWIVSDGY